MQESENLMENMNCRRVAPLGYSKLRFKFMSKKHIISLGKEVFINIDANRFDPGCEIAQW